MLYFIKRTAAYWIDCIVAFGISMLLIQWAILSQIRGYIGIDDVWFQSSWNMEFYVLLTISLPVWLYFSLTESSAGQRSLGKRLMGLRLESTVPGERISFFRALGRTLLKLLPWEIAHLGVIFPTPMYYAENPEIRWATYLGMALFVLYVFRIVQSKTAQAPYDVLFRTQVRPKKK